MNKIFILLTYFISKALPFSSYPICQNSLREEGKKSGGAGQHTGDSGTDKKRETGDKDLAWEIARQGVGVYQLQEQSDLDNKASGLAIKAKAGKKSPPEFRCLSAPRRQQWGRGSKGNTMSLEQNTLPTLRELQKAIGLISCQMLKKLKTTNGKLFV